jgi:hypothetical protein
LPPPPRLRTTGPASAAAVKSEDDQPHQLGECRVLTCTYDYDCERRPCIRASEQPTVRVRVFPCYRRQRAQAPTRLIGERSNQLTNAGNAMKANISHYCTANESNSWVPAPRIPVTYSPALHAAPKFTT